MRDIKEALKYHFDNLIAAGYKKEEILGVFVYGSQNYNFAHDGSDVDTKAIILPTWERLVHGPVLSKEHHWENGEHCEVKDIQEFARMLYKQNVNFLEVLYTDYALVNSEFKSLWETNILSLRDKIVRYDVNAGVKSICGQALNTIKQAMGMLDSDPVQAGKKYANSVRLMIYLKDYQRGAYYKDAITLSGLDKQILLPYKTGEMSPTPDMLEKLRELFRVEMEESSGAPISEVKAELDKAVADICWYKVNRDRTGYPPIDFY
jgi:predicted nucleotidyltransferase